MAEEFIKVVDEGDNVNNVKILFDSEVIDTDSKIGESGETPLTYAAWKGRIEIVRYLVEHRGVDVGQLGSFNSTALMWASNHGHLKVVEYLLSMDAEVDCINYFGNTALILASWSGREDVVELLLNAGADLTIVDGESESARSCAKTDGIRKMLDSEENIRKRLQIKEEECNNKLKEQKEKMEKEFQSKMSEENIMMKKNKEKFNEIIDVMEKEFKHRLNENDMKENEKTLNEIIKALERKLKEITSVSSEHNKNSEDLEREDAAAEDEQTKMFKENLEARKIKFTECAEKKRREKVERKDFREMLKRLELSELEKICSSKKNKFLETSEMKINELKVLECAVEDKECLIKKYKEEIKDMRKTVEVMRKEAALLEKRCQEKKMMIAEENGDVQKLRIGIEEAKINGRFREIDQRETMEFLEKLMSKRRGEIKNTHALLVKKMKHQF